MLVRIISMVIAGVIIVYLVRWIDNFSPGIANKSCLQCKPNTPICFPLQPMLTKCGHFLILKQENRKSFLLAICGFPCDSVAIRNIKYYKTNTYNIILKIRVI